MKRYLLLFLIVTLQISCVDKENKNQMMKYSSEILNNDPDLENFEF